MNQDDLQLSPEELKAFDETELNEELLALSDESGLLDEMLAASKVGPTPEALRYERQPDGNPTPFQLAGPLDDQVDPLAFEPRLPRGPQSTEYAAMQAAMDDERALDILEQNQDVAEIPLADLGFPDITEKDMAEARAILENESSFLKEVLPGFLGGGGPGAGWNKTDSPWLGGGWATHELITGRAALIKFDAGVADHDQQKIVLGMMMDSERDLRFDAEVGIVTRSLGTSVVEFASGGGVASAAARLGSRAALRMFGKEALQKLYQSRLLRATETYATHLALRSPALAGAMEKSAKILKSGKFKAATAGTIGTTIGQEAVPRLLLNDQGQFELFGGSGGAWTAASIREMFQNDDLTEDEAKVVASMANELIPAFLRSRSKLYQGFIDVAVTNAVEMYGVTAITKLPPFAVVKAVEGKILQKIAGPKGVRGLVEFAEQVGKEGTVNGSMLRSAQAALDGWVDQTMEEVLGNVASQAAVGLVSGDPAMAARFMAALPQDVRETAVLIASSGVPFGVKASGGALSRFIKAHDRKLQGELNEPIDDVSKIELGEVIEVETGDLAGLRGRVVEVRYEQDPEGVRRRDVRRTGPYEPDGPVEQTTELAPFEEQTDLAPRGDNLPPETRTVEILPETQTTYDYGEVIDPMDPEYEEGLEGGARGSVVLELPSATPDGQPQRVRVDIRGSTFARPPVPGGDSVSSGDSTDATSGEEPDVFTPFQPDEDEIERNRTDEDRQEDVEGYAESLRRGLGQDVEVEVADVDNDLRRKAARVAARFGAPVTFVQSPDGSPLPAAGWMNPSTGSIVIDVNGKLGQGVAYHELVHLGRDAMGQEWLDGLYNDFIELDPEGMERAHQEGLQRRADAGMRPLSDPVALEEDVADRVEQLGDYLTFLDNPAEARRVAEKLAEDPSLARRFFERLMDLLSRMTGGRISPSERTRMMRDVERFAEGDMNAPEMAARILEAFETLGEGLRAERAANERAAEQQQARQQARAQAARPQATERIEATQDTRVAPFEAAATAESDPSVRRGRVLDVEGRTVSTPFTARALPAGTEADLENLQEGDAVEVFGAPAEIVYAGDPARYQVRFPEQGGREAVVEAADVTLPAVRQVTGEEAAQELRQARQEREQRQAAEAEEPTVTFTISPAADAALGLDESEMLESKVLARALQVKSLKSGKKYTLTLSDAKELYSLIEDHWIDEEGTIFEIGDRLAYRGLVRRVKNAIEKAEGDVEQRFALSKNPRADKQLRALITLDVARGGFSRMRTDQEIARFRAALKKNKGSVTLTQYTAEELRDRSKFHVYKLDSADIYYAAKVVEREDGTTGFDVVGVVNNAGPAAKGLAAPGVMLHAIETLEGDFLTLDAFDVAGFLPEYYRSFGFEATETLEFDASYWDPKDLKKAIKYWQESSRGAWNPSYNEDGALINGPSVVMMALEVPHADRQGARKAYFGPLTGGEGGVQGQAADLSAGLLSGDEQEAGRARGSGVPEAGAEPAEGDDRAGRRARLFVTLRETSAARPIQSLIEIRSKDRGRAPSSYIDIVEGNEAFEPERDKAGGHASVASMARAFEARAEVMGYKVGDPNNLTPEEINSVAEGIYDELEFALQKDRSGIGWYERKIKDAIEILTEIHPELITPGPARIAFTAGLAVTSNGQNVIENFRYAEEVYSAWKATGKFPQEVEFGGERKSAIEDGLTLLNKLFAEKGVEAAGEFLLQTHSVKTLTDMGYKASDIARFEAPGSIILGPKVGIFFVNLNGQFEHLTADVWFARTWNRHLGWLMSATDESIQRKMVSFQETLVDPPPMVRQFIRSTGLTLKDVRRKRDTTAAELLARFAEKALRKAKFKYKKIEGYTDDAKEFFTKANSLVKELSNPVIAAPRNNSEREMMRQVLRRVQALREQRGLTHITLSDIQAVLWFFEKDFFTEYGATNSRGQSADYSDAALELKERVQFERSMDGSDTIEYERPDEDADETYALAPKGDPAFDKFFGQSQAVDFNGRPLVVYHGTDAEPFTEFDPLHGDLGFHLGTATQAEVRLMHKGDKPGSRVMPLYARIERPLTLPDVREWNNAIKVLEAVEAAGVPGFAPEVSEAVRDMLADYEGDTEAFIEEGASWEGLSLIRGELQRLGYDGVVYENVHESRGMAPDFSIIVFDPTQMKSATGNNGSYSRQEADLRFALAQTVRKGFQTFFDGSQVVDENGEPLLMTHYTDADDPFTEFKLKQKWDEGYHGKGFYFGSVDFLQRTVYGTRAGQRPPVEDVEENYGSRYSIGARVYPVYLNIRNPKRVVHTDRSLLGASIESLEQQGYDGVLVMDKDGKKIINAVAFNPTQIKSAIGNDGDFSLNERDMRYALAPTPDVNSEEFKAWFRKSAVVGTDGEPLIVYHGTSGRWKAPRRKFVGEEAAAATAHWNLTNYEKKVRTYNKRFRKDDTEEQRAIQDERHSQGLAAYEAAFRAFPERIQDIVIREYLEQETGETPTIFDPDRRGLTDGGYYSQGSYFTPDPKEASDYAMHAGQTGARVIPAYLSIQNPYSVFSPKEDRIRAEDAYHESYMGKIRNGREVIDAEGAGSLAKRLVLEDMGYDGEIVYDKQKKNVLEYVIFDATQVKSAIGNDGSYGLDERDSRFALAPQTETEQFRKFFSGSQAIDLDGKPLRLYHMGRVGTISEYDDIKKTMVEVEQKPFTVLKPGGRDPRISGRAIWMSPNPSDTPAYHNQVRGQAGQDGAFIMELYASIKRPLVVDGANYEWAKEMYGSEFPYLISDEALKFLQEDGYDGVMLYGQTLKESRSFNLDELPTEVVALDSTQVKSATGNNGDFGGDPDLRFALNPSESLGLPDAKTIEQPFHRTRAFLFDRYISVTELSEWARSCGAMMSHDPESAIRRSYGRKADRGEQLYEKYIKPINQLMRGTDITIGTTGDYVENRHIPEANEAFYRQYERLQSVKEGRTLSKALLRQLQKERKETVKETAEAKRELARMKRDGSLGPDGMRPFERAVEIGDLAVERIDRETRMAEKDIRYFEREISALRHVDFRIPEGIEPSEYFHEVRPLYRIKTSDAKAHVKAKEEGEYGEQYKAIAKLYDAMIAKTRDGMLEDGLLSEEQHADWVAKFRRYAPMHSSEVTDDNFPRIGGGFSVRGPETKMRRGNKERENPYVYAVKMAGNAIMRGEKNRVGNDFYHFAEENQELLEFSFRDLERDEDGELATKPSEFVTKIKGKEVAINIHNPEMAAQIMSLGQSAGYPALMGATRVFSSLSNLIRYTATSLSPSFVATNITRDVQTAVMNTPSVAQKHNLNAKELQKALIQDVKGAIKATYAWRRGTTSDPRMDEKLRQYREAGGRIGMFASKEFDDLLKEMTRSNRIETMGGIAGKTVRGLISVKDLIDDANMAVETGSRLALFAALTDRGVSVNDAALAARQLTTDFNQHGHLGRALSPFYAFANASLIGNYRLIQELVSPKGSRTVAGQQLMLRIGKLVAIGALLPLIGELIGGEDDDGLSVYSKIPEHTKQRNYCLPIAGLVIKVPQAYGWSMFPNAGRLGTEVAMGKITIERALQSLFGEAVSTMNPRGSSPTLLQFASPTGTEPFMQVYENKDFLGRPVHVPDNPFGPEMARHERNRRNTGEAAIGTAEFINSITGGDRVDPGVVNLSGDDIEHIARSFGGGAWKFVTNTQKTLGRAFRGDFRAEDMNVLPILRRYVGANLAATDRKRFYEELDELYRLDRKMDLAKADGDGEMYRELRRRHGRVLPMLKKGEAVKKKVAELKDRAYEMDPNGDRDLLDAADRLIQNWVLQYMERGGSVAD